MQFNGFVLAADSSDNIVSGVKKVKAGVVAIITRVEGSVTEGGGAGIIISSNGYIMTNSHVIQGARIIKVKLANNRIYSGYVIKAAAERDLAVIKIDCDNLFVPTFGDSSVLEPGQTVFAIGNPFKLSGSVTKGIVSALNRDINACGVAYRDLIQTDAAINPGSSGGALCTEKGEVVGINTLVRTGTAEQPYATGVGFAIPINAALKIARQLIKNKTSTKPRPWIGMTGKTLLRETADAYGIRIRYGVLVSEVEQDGPCERAGITAGDVITEINGQRLTSIDDFRSTVNAYSPGQAIELTVWHRESSGSDPADLQYRKKTVIVTIDCNSR